MLTVAQVRTLLPHYAYTILIDLTDAYRHVPVARGFTPYLGFHLGNRKYTPKVFTKLAAAVIQQLRAQGIQVADYLDD